MDIYKIWALASFAILISAVTGIFQEWIRGTISRHKKGDSWLLAFYNLINANRPRYGGYIVHLSVVMLGVGIVASSFYSIQNDFVMKPGETKTIENYSFTYIEKEEYIYSDRKQQIAKFNVKNKNENLGYLYPERSFYPIFRISATKGAIHSSLLEDFYLVPSEFREDGQAVFRVLINPMMIWMWLAGPVLIFGTIFALIPGRSRKTKVLLADILKDKPVEV
jgi:cytochrome c-type biogenesis protein CcmF